MADRIVEQIDQDLDNAARFAIGQQGLFGADQFKVFAIKSRVHFRRGFDDSGFAKTILLVEPEQPFLGTVRLEALPYRHVDISKLYPYGDVSFP